MAEKSDIFDYGRLGGEPDEGASSGQYRYRQWMEGAHGDRMAAAGEVYRGASDASEARGVQLRSEGLQQHYAGAGGGSALAARAAIGGLGQASFAAGAQEAQLGSRDRLRAAGSYVDAQTQRAAYEQALFDQYMARKAAYDQASDRGLRAREAVEQGRKEMIQQLIGSGASAGGAMLASSGGGYGGGGGAPQQQQGGYAYSGGTPQQRQGYQDQYTQQGQGYDPYADYYTHYGSGGSF